ncbi:MAG: hypothetical protein K6G56_02645 [Clostridiales bacterium]|nr:hypothetical protein [Clostridiales bacterium]
MKKSLSILLAAITALVFLASGVFAAPAETEYYIGLTEADALKDAPRDGRVRKGLELAETPELAVFTTVLAVPCGRGETEIGFDRHILDGKPEDFFVRKDGSVAILDSVNMRIKVFGRSGVIESIPVPGHYYPVSMTETNEAFFVLDFYGYVYRIDKKTKTAEEYAAVKMPPEFQTQCIRADGSDLYICTSGLSMRSVGCEFTSSMKDAYREALSARREQFRLHAEKFVYIGKNDKGSLVFESLFPVDRYLDYYERLLCRRDPVSGTIGCALLRTEEYSVLPSNHIRIGEDGKLYVMACMDGCTAVFQVELGSEYESHADELRERAECFYNRIKYSERETKTDVVTVIEFSQSSVLPAIAVRPYIQHILLLKRSFIPYHYEDPFCRIFFRVILQAPG